jgi:putative ABC transport system permease protein
MFLPWHEISPGYLATAGIDLLQGRPFTSEDRDAVAIVNTVLAERLWPGRTAIGSMFRTRPTDPWLTVIGIARDVPQMGPRDPWGDGMEYYVPIPADLRQPGVNFILRTSVPPAAVAEAIRRVIRGIDAEQPIDRLLPFRDALGERVAQERFYLQLIALFAVLATGLAALGLHAVLSQVMSRRMREIGIRVALGADRRSVMRLVIGSGAGMVGLGILIGLALAVGLTRFLESLLFGIAPRDPLTLAANVLVLLAVGVFASLLPARRALALDPATVMRVE